MRDGVVHVQKVEAIELGDFRHARGQRQIVGRIIEQWITRNIHLVVVDVGMQFGESDGLGIGDEMNFVPTMGQFQPELGSNHPAATVCRIAGNPDLHVGPSHAGGVVDCLIRW